MVSIRGCCVVAFVVVLFLSASNTLPAVESGKLLAGVARVEITPPPGTPLVSPYGEKPAPQPSDPIHDPLYATALVFDLDGYRVGILACDLILNSNKSIGALARERLNIPFLLMSSSHTHSGFGMRGSDFPYAVKMESVLLGALEQAVKNMFPARLAAGYASFPQLGYNRLLMREDGHARALWENFIDRIPYGPVDPEVGVIKVEDENGNCRAVLLSYACHSVVVMRNYEISADYPGVAKRKVEEALGGNAICLFVQGGAGDINPIFMSPRRKDAKDTSPIDYTQMDRMGTLLAEQTVKLTRSLAPGTPAKPSLKAINDTLKFTGRFDQTRTSEINFTTVLINDSIALATFPGEPFVFFQLFWKKNAEVPHPFFFGYTYTSAGDYAGYVPDIRSAAYGGYGADSNEGALQVGAGEAIMNKHLENLYRLRGILRDRPGPR